MQAADIRPRVEIEKIPRDYNKIGVVHFKLFRTDGISLESQQLAFELSKPGLDKEIHFLSADVPRSRERKGLGKKIPDLSYQRGWPAKLKKRIFGDFEVREGEEERLLLEIDSKANIIYDQLKEYIDTKGLGVVHIRNIFGLPLNIPAAVALNRLMGEKQDVAFIIHNADHIWEGRESQYKTPYTRIQKIIDDLFPPKMEGKNVQYVVINSGAREELKKRGIEAHLITDSFDFKKLRPEDDPKKGPEYVREMRKAFGFSDTDIVLGQMTRIINRKAVERTIQVAAAMNKYIKTPQFREAIKMYGGSLPMNIGNLTTVSEVKIFIPQDEDLKDHKEYVEAINGLANASGVKIVWGRGRVKYHSNGHDGKYSFYDTYSILNLNAFPSQREGFGNQFLESLWAKVLSIVYEYDVFQRDIKLATDGGFSLDTISLGDDNDLVEPYVAGSKKMSLVRYEKVWEAAKKAIDWLSRSDEYAERAKRNFAVAQANWDVSIASNIFTKVLDSAVSAI